MNEMITYKDGNKRYDGNTSLPLILYAKKKVSILNIPAINENLKEKENFFFGFNLLSRLLAKYNLIFSMF
jgi:hypothetical protein